MDYFFEDEKILKEELMIGKTVMNHRSFQYCKLQDNNGKDTDHNFEDEEDWEDDDWEDEYEDVDDEDEDDFIDEEDDEFDDFEDEEDLYKEEDREEDWTEDDWN